MRIRTASRVRLLCASALVVLVAAGGCGGEVPTTPAAATTTVTTTPDYPGWVYTGTLAVLGTDQSITFPVATAGSFAITFGALALPDGTPVSYPVTFGIGLSTNSVCTPTTTTTAVPGLVAQITGTLQSGLGCIIATDPGGLTDTGTYTVRVVVGPITSTASAATETFTNTLEVGGTDLHTFLTNAGTVSATLASAGVTGTFPLGLGLYDGTACRVTTLVMVTPGDGRGPQAQGDAGEYCVRLSDPGLLTTTTSFSITIKHP
jgi:hypothetical protein